MTDTTPAAVAAVREKLDTFEGWLYAMDLAGLSEVQPNLHEVSAMLAALADERDAANRLVGMSGKLSRATLDAFDAAEAEAARLREALRMIAEVDLTGHGVPHDFALNVLAARAALKENPDD